MKCLLCSEPATVHLTDVSQGTHQEHHLCSKCAEENAYFGMVPDLPMVPILTSALQSESEHSEISCDYCGNSLQEFHASGLLGCAGDYEQLQGVVDTMLMKIQNSIRHVGKRPKRGSQMARDFVRLRLRRQLRTAIETEDYRLASQLRDRLANRETRHEY